LSLMSAPSRFILLNKEMLTCLMETSVPNASESLFVAMPASQFCTKSVWIANHINSNNAKIVNTVRRNILKKRFRIGCLCSVKITESRPYGKFNTNLNIQKGNLYCK
jgi:hypothetical protein